MRGGNGTCPVCRSPISNILRIGPDAQDAAGRTVALVLPTDYMQWAP